MIVLIAAAALAAASSPTPSPTASPVPEIAHVVTSDRGKESALRAARTTYVVTSTDIARNGYRTVADALTAVPGVSVTRYGPFGAEANVGIRGSSSAQVLVLLNGLPIAGAQIENVNLEQYGTSGIDRIEVVEGGGSSLYGSGSIGGIINIISTGQAPSSATVATGSFDQQTYQLQTPYLSFQRTYAANDYGLPNGSTRTNADAGLTSGTLTYARTIGAFNLEFLAGASDASLGVPGGYPFLSSTSRQDTISRDLRLQVQKQSKRANFSLNVGASSQDVTFACNTPYDSACPNFEAPAPYTTPPPYSQYANDQRVMLQANDAVGDDRARLIYGIDLSRGTDRVDGGTGSACPLKYAYYSKCGQLAYQASVTGNAYAQTAAYVQQQWFFNNGGEVYAGLRGERDLNELATAQGGALSPAIGGIVPLNSALQLKLNAATAFRAPNAEELFYPPQGYYSNPALVPERTRVGDATLVDRTAWGQASFGWFTTSGSNLIADSGSGKAPYEPINVQRASIQGFTLSAATNPIDHLVTTLGVTNLYRAQDLETNERINGRGPVFATTLGFRYVTAASSRFDGAGVTITNSGAVEPPNVNTPYITVPYWAQASAFTTVDAYAGVRIAPRFVLTLRGFNLLNDRYAVFSGYPMPGPSFSVELRSR